MNKTCNSDVWIPFSDDSLPDGYLDEQCLQKLETLWLSALRLLGYDTSSIGTNFFRQEDGRAYYNAGLLVSILTKDCLRMLAANTEKPGKIIKAKGLIRTTFELIRLHWKLEKFLASSGAKLGLHYSDDADSSRALSLALGICQQALIMRLPKHTPETLARWIMAPLAAPAMARPTIFRLLSIQEQRDALASAWKNFFQVSSNVPTHSAPSHADEFSSVLSRERNSWKGLPVSPGITDGEYLVVSAQTTADISMESILIFEKASPETVRLFAKAKGLVFVTGGVLSHACSVARERGIPCITGVGYGFLKELKRRQPKGLRINVEDGTVSFTNG
jgi:phosphohistidine swiveling domain-containing protein